MESVRESSSRRRRQHPPITTTATTTSKTSRSTPRRRRRQPRPPTPTPTSDDEAQETRPTIGRDAAAYMRQADAGIGTRRVLEFARGDAALRESAAALSGGTAESWMSGSGGGGDEEGLGLLRQQLSAVQRIRIEHERKDATIAALRLEVSTLSRQREEMLALNRERNGELLRLVRMEETVRRLEEGERDTARRCTREEEAWRKQLRDMQEQCRAERDRAEELAALEPALAKARSEAVAAAAAAARDEAGRAEAEFRAGTITERLNAEMERERAKSRGLEDKLRVLEEELAGANRLIPEVKSIQGANEALRAELVVASERRSEVELELAQLKVYRPLVERADFIDRRRVAAEEGLRAATAELSRERDALAAAKDGAAELRLALERRELRLAEAEAEASKALSLERDLLSATGRLEAAQAARTDAESSRRENASALAELAELAFNALPPPAALPRAPAVEGRVSSAAAAASEGCGRSGDARSAAVAGLAGLEGGVRQRGGGPRAEVDSGDGDGERKTGREDEEEEEGRGGGGRMEAGRCSDGVARAARAVRALAQAGMAAAADRDHATKELVDARGELRSALDRLEASQREGTRVRRALEDACAARSALLPRLRDTQVSRAAAEAAADRASAELGDIRGFLVELSALLARSNAEAASDGEASPGWSTNGSSTIPPSASDAPGAGAGAGGCVKVVAAISAGVKGLLAERTVAASALRELDNRFSQGKREAEEASADARDRDTAHREQLVELRSWCESEVEAQRRAKRAAQTAADCALRDLSTARRLISDFEKEKARISGNAVALNARLSTVTEEASAAKNGLRLLARACWPLLERCRLLAEHKRLLAKWHDSSAAAAADGAAAAARRGGGAMLGAVARRPRAGGRGGGVGGGAASTEAAADAAAPGSQQPTMVLIIDGLRSLVDALSQDGDEEEGQAGRGLGSENGGGDPPAPASRAHGTPRRPGSSEGGGGCGEVGDTAGNVHNHQHHDKRQQRRPLVSLRATCIAAVAVQRLVRLAACRASRREAARAASAAATANSSQPDPPPPPTAAGGRPSPSRHGDAGIGEAIIPLGPRGSGGGSGGGGVPMLLDTQVVSPGSMSLALMSLLGDHSKDGTGDPSQAGGVACRGDGGGGGGGGGGGSGDGERCMGLLGALVVVDAGNISSAAATGEWFGRGFEGTAVETGAARDAAGRTSLLEVLAGGQVGHWRRVEKRGLVPWAGSGGGSGSDPRLLGGASRVVASRCARHHGQDVWKAWQERAAAEEACSLLGATRRGTAALARLAGEAERRLLESEAGRLQAKAEVEALEASKQALRVALEKKSELVSFLEERVQMMEGEASGTVPAAALAGTEKALTESLAEVETLRVRSASLYAELAEASAQRKREARQARKGAQVANQEKAIRAQLQDELLSLRSYVLRSEQTVQELQEQARRQAREQGRYTDSSGGDSTGRNTHRDEPFLAVADQAAAPEGLF